MDWKVKIRECFESNENKNTTYQKFGILLKQYTEGNFSTENLYTSEKIFVSSQ